MALPTYPCTVCGKENDYLHCSPLSLMAGGQGDEDVLADMILCCECWDRTIALIVERMRELGAKVHESKL